MNPYSQPESKIPARCQAILRAQNEPFFLITTEADTVTSNDPATSRITVLRKRTAHWRVRREPAEADREPNKRVTTLD